MTSEETGSSASSKALKGYVIAGAVFGALVVFALIFIYASRTPPRTSSAAGVVETDKLEGARRDLAKATDHGTCRNVIQQINLYLSDHANRRSPALTADQRAFLTEHCLGNPNENEMVEVEGGAYTLLDAHYLSECYLFRDAAQSLEIDGRPAAERAEAAFRWIVRQVRLRESMAPAKPDGEPDPVPPEFVVRRGWGTAQERALAFLALLRQLDVEGWLVVSPSAGNGPPLCWACGALIDAKDKEGARTQDLLLFDPRMGIPLPGPKGEGIATLAELRDHPDLLKMLTVNPDFPYDVTPEQVAGVEIQLVEPLSALSPRMAVLQKDLLGAGIKGRLSANPKESLGRLVEVAKPLNVTVRIGTRWTGVLRRFLPPDDGGSDKGFGFSFRSLPGYLGRNADEPPARMTRQKLFELQLAAWSYFPDLARELPWATELGQRPRIVFDQLFVAYHLAPRQPRDQVLRGHYEEAVGTLSVKFREKYSADKQRLSEALANGLNDKVRAWKDFAFNAYGTLARAEEQGADVADAKHQVETVWKEKAQPLFVLIDGQAAKPLDAEATYLIALAWHEQAIRLQTRIDRDRQAERTLNPNDVDAARSAWKTTLSWWRTLATDPAASVQNVNARRWQAETYLALDDRTTAHAFLVDLSGELTPLEKTARLYLASRIKK